MKSASIIILVVAALLAAGSSYASSQKSGSQPMGADEKTYMILCLNHNLSERNFDVSVAPVYDWVHAGQQGLYVTVTNKTNEDMTVDWTANSQLGRGSSTEKPYDIVPPGVTFSRTLWPRSSVLKVGRFQNRSIQIGLKTSSGAELRDSILIDVQGERGVCST
jgi:hypothetical protein